MNDLINGCIELLGALLLVGNCRLLYSHKAVQGVSVLTTAFFTLWGIWNLYFYPANNLWLSFVGGLCLAGANLTWVVMAIANRIWKFDFSVLLDPRDPGLRRAIGF